MLRCILRTGRIGIGGGGESGTVPQDGFRTSEDMRECFNDYAAGDPK